MSYKVLEPIAEAPHLDQLILRSSLSNAAHTLGVDGRTVRRWAAGETEVPKWVDKASRANLTFHTPERDTSFSFIDLFAGIGGTRLGFEAAGGRCVFSSEWDAFARKTYATNFLDDPENHQFAGDITKVSAASVPDHDVLIGGFPCQPFSIAGVSKKQSLGRAHGFLDETQGTLFFDIARIIKEKQPKAFLLENVKNLRSHDKGKTFRVILKTLEDELGYHVYPRVLNAKSWVPQGRERIYLVGFREPVKFSWDDFPIPAIGPKLVTILHPEDGTESSQLPYTDLDGLVDPKYQLSDKLWNYLQAYKEKHQSAGNGFGFGLVGPADIARTLSARYYKDGSEILIKMEENFNPRRLTPREAGRLMGFPDSFKIPVSDTQAYKQFGNSVVMPTIEAIAKHMVSSLKQPLEN